MVVFLGQVTGGLWRDLGGPVAILVAGLGLVAAAVLLARLRPAAATQASQLSRGPRSGR
jgi:glucose dehydrogenase